MSATRQCPRCGAELPADAPEGLCPQCLLQQAMGTVSGTSQVQEARTAHFSGFVPSAPSELAKHFPQLEILELLGQGGMGVVYKARQPGLDRFVALKILPPDAGRDPAFAERFSREARSLAKLVHPGIVTVHDSGKADGLYYFIMEFVDGLNLRHALREGKLEPEVALQIVPQICEALQFAHEEGVVHRDIKPENILLDKKGRVKIADFGLAKLLGERPAATGLTGSGQVMGTPHYMAPEQTERPLQVDHRADIFSLGVVFYEMLTGELPLGRFDAPSQKVHVDVRLDEVVLRSLQKEPERRYQQISELKTDVETISKPGSQPQSDSVANRDAMDQATIASRTMPRDLVDILLALAAVPVVYGIFFVPFMLVSWSSGFPALGVVAGLATVLVLGLLLSLPSVQSITIDKDGITFIRHVGRTTKVAWNEIAEIQEVSRWEAFRRVWLWPGIPPRGSIFCMSALYHYRIEWKGGCYYFPPKSRKSFLKAVNQWHGTKSSATKAE